MKDLKFLNNYFDEIRKLLSEEKYFEDLVKVKDVCAYGGVLMQRIAGREALILSHQEHNPGMIPLRCFVLIGGKRYLVWAGDLEQIDEIG